MTAVPKVPPAPPEPLVFRSGDLTTVSPDRIVWRVHRTQGEHVVPWNELRHFGPLATARWDPHPLPPGDHSAGVCYTATDPATALAEVFQLTRQIDTESGRPYLTGWSPTRELRLLDLNGDWALRNHAASALTSARRSVCRTWARAIATRRLGLDGLWVDSTMTGRPNVVLWVPAADSFPAAPRFSMALSDPNLRIVVKRIAEQDLNYALI